MIQWLQANIAKYKGNPNRMFIWAHSAGNGPLGIYIGHPELHGPKGAGVKGAVFILSGNPVKQNFGAPATPWRRRGAGGRGGFARGLAKRPHKAVALHRQRVGWSRVNVRRWRRPSFGSSTAGAISVTGRSVCTTPRGSPAAADRPGSSSSGGRGDRHTVEAGARPTMAPLETGASRRGRVVGWSTTRCSHQRRTISRTRTASPGFKGATKVAGTGQPARAELRIPA